MAGNSKTLPLEVSGSFIKDDKPWAVRKAIVRERLGRLTETTIEVMSSDTGVKLEDVLGQQITLELTDAEKKTRNFGGIVTAITKLALKGGLLHLVVDVRPNFWLLTKTTDSRIFQEKSSVDIIEEVCKLYGVSLQKKLSGSYSKRTYCVQYRETDFDFLSRLMEEEGIYYRFDYSSTSQEKLVLCDAKGSHGSIGNIEIVASDDGGLKTDERIVEFVYGEAIVPKTVTLDDFDFEKPTAKLEAKQNIQLSQKKHNTLELYDHPGRYSEASLGTNFARTRIDIENQGGRPVRGKCTRWDMETGLTFKPEERDDVKGNEYLTTGATHYMQATDAYEFSAGGLVALDRPRDTADDALEFPDYANQIYASEFDALETKWPFRAPRETAKPVIAGLQTALVTGKSGEEIWTDKYGRIKVQFHWDREGKKDEKTSCWVRVVTPVSGKGWGMVHIPRIGQEVVIQFEEGDPDRPICTGMLYNADHMQPYELPANQTQSGLMSRSTKQGGKTNYNELVFEDKKGAEFMRVQAEKDQETLIKDRRVMTVGLDKVAKELSKADAKSYTFVVNQHLTETVQKGDHTFEVSTGQQKVTIATDQTEDVGSNVTKTVGSNKDVTIGSNLTEDVGSNQTTNVGSNLKLDVGSNITEEAGQKISIKAGMEIKLTVGSSSIKISPTGVEIKGPMVQINGSTMTEVKGGATLILKGGMTMIN